MQVVERPAGALGADWASDFQQQQQGSGAASTSAAQGSAGLQVCTAWVHNDAPMVFFPAALISVAHTHSSYTHCIGHLFGAAGDGVGGGVCGQAGRRPGPGR